MLCSPVRHILSEQIKEQSCYANETKRHTTDIELTARLEEKC